MPATSTGGGCCRPRPFASSRRCTALRAERIGGDRRRPCRWAGPRVRRGRSPGGHGACRRAAAPRRCSRIRETCRFECTGSRLGAQGRTAVVARSRMVRSGWVAAARQPSAVSSARMSAPCHSPCSMTTVPPGCARRRRGAAHLRARHRGRPGRRRGPPAGRGDAPRGRAGSRHPARRAGWRRRRRRCRRAPGTHSRGRRRTRCALPAPTRSKFSRVQRKASTRVLRGVDARMRHFGREGEGDRAAARSEVHGDRRRGTPRRSARRSRSGRRSRSRAGGRRRPVPRAARGGGTARCR